MKKKNLIIGTVSFIVLIVFMIFMSSERTTKPTNTISAFTTAKQSDFEIAVLTTGELQAQNYSEITAPPTLQSRTLRISSIKITDMVAEGTVVTKGDYVATLDKTDLDNTLKNEYETLTTAQTNLEMKILDTAVTMSGARDNIMNIKSNIDEAEIVLQQSRFEPPATIRKAEMNLDKAKRSLEQSQSSYELKVQQSESDIRTIKTTLANQQKKVDELQSVLDQFIINAPADGMVIYKKDNTGAKRKVGSTISSYDLVVATLPDLTSMVSKTYVNEIDVNKIKVGQKVRLVVDAFSERRYDGEVINVSNIGEQLPSANAKVFEVNILVTSFDEVLRPSMTSGNIIIIETLKNVVHVPLSCVHTEGNKTFVYLKDKTKQEVVCGKADESEIVIEQGLEVGTVIYMENPYLLAKN